MALSDDIVAERNCGVVHCGLSSKPSPSLPELAREFGLADNSTSYREIDVVAAKRLVQLILHKDMANDGEIMPVDRATELTDLFFAQFGLDGVRFFTNGNFHELLRSGASWNPVSAATFDTGVLARAVPGAFGLKTKTSSAELVTFHVWSTQGDVMRKDAWIELARHRYDKVWDSFDEAFDFKPSVRPEDWPTFKEPTPSVTWDISDLLGEFYPWHDPQATPHNLALLRALKECVADNEPVLALDWQHASYEFHPHRFRSPDEPKNWCIPALPSGEYHLFVTEDHRLGSLGHPWAQTLCVFGEGFVDAYLHASPLRKDKIIRQQFAARKVGRSLAAGGGRRRNGRRK